MLLRPTRDDGRLAEFLDLQLGYPAKRLGQRFLTYCISSLHEVVMSCTEYARFRQRYGKALRRWGKVFLSRSEETGLAKLAAWQIDELKQRTLEERDAARERMYLHQQICPACREATRQQHSASKVLERLAKVIPFKTARQ